MPPPKQDKTMFAHRNQPHLRFEITSDDGFHVQADSIEGENLSLTTETLAVTYIGVTIPFCI